MKDRSRQDGKIREIIDCGVLLLFVCFGWGLDMKPVLHHFKMASLRRMHGGLHKSQSKASNYIKAFLETQGNRPELES